MTGSPSPSAVPLVPASRLGDWPPYARQESTWDIDLRLDANEGTPRGETLALALAAVDVETARRYPEAAELEQRIAARWGVAPERVVVTNGGDEAIDRTCRAVLEPGRTALVHAPTFEMIERSARLAGGDVQVVPWRDGAFPAAAFAGAIGDTTKLVVLVTPNNPTGGAIAADDCRAIAVAARERGAVTLVDVAYAEFAEDDPTRALCDLDNVVLVRTFSKALGLAGLRVGYAIAPPPIAVWLRTVGGPYPVASVSLAVAAASLDDEVGPAAFVARVRQEREQLATMLDELGAEPIPSEANFVTARFADAAFVRDGLASLGIAVRGFARPADLAPYLRITLPGEAPAFDRLGRALRAALRPGALLLDLDGVVADVSGSYRTAIAGTARSFGVMVTAGDIAAAKRAGAANNDWELTRRLLGERGIDVALEEVTARFQSIYLGAGATPGVRETETLIPSGDVLRRLAARTPLAVVTGRPRAEAAWFLDRAGVADLFDALVCLEDAPAKPAPDAVRLALGRLGVDAAWMVGDTPDDVRAARAAGVVPIGVVAPGDDGAAMSAALRAAGAPRVIESLEDLERMLP